MYSERNHHLKCVTTLSLRTIFSIFLHSYSTRSTHSICLLLFFSIIIQYLTSCPLQINKERVGWLVSLLAFRNILYSSQNHIFVSPTDSELGWCQLNRIWAQGRPSSVCELFADSFLSGASILSILVQSSPHISWGYYIQSNVIHSKFWGWIQGGSTF